MSNPREAYLPCRTQKPSLMGRGNLRTMQSGVAQSNSTDH